ncbi:MAG: ATP-binding protein [Desulfobacterales bacterium]
MADESNKAPSPTARRALRKIVDRIAGSEDFGLTKDEQLELLRLNHELDNYRFELELLQGELENRDEQLRKLSRDLETAGIDLFDNLDFIPVAFLRLSQKGIIEKINSAARQLLAGSERSLIGSPFSNFVKPEDLGIYFGGIKNIATKNSLSSFEMHLVNAKNKEFHALVQVEPIFEPTGKFSHWHLAFFDDTEARLLNMRLKEVHEQLELAARSAELGVWNYDMANGKAKWNRQLYSLLGLEPREGPEDARRFFEFIHPEDRTGSIANVSAVLDSCVDHIKEEFRVVRADGKTRWLAARGRIFRDKSGRVTRISGINFDITERKKIEETVHLAQLQLSMQLAETNRINEELSQYAYAVSHDLRGPLRAIRNYAEFLYEDLADTLTGDQKNYLEGLKTAVDQGDALINDLLNLARIDRVPLEMEGADVPGLVGEIRSMLDLPAEVEITVATQWPEFSVGRTLLKQILQNLISNSVKFNERNPKCIEIGWQAAPDDRIDIFVRDNGIGIEPQYREQIFRIFQRLHTDRDYEGTGIGLAIVQKAVNKLGGSVRLESEPGKGSTFYIRLPRKVTDMEKDTRSQVSNDDVYY